MKNGVKNRSADSHSASDAAALLGVSVPTLRRMVKDGALDGFRTPGGHLRVTAESIEAARSHEAQPTRTREASPVLRNRRERIEELTLEAQEMRARRELGKLRREDQEEAEQRQAEAQARQEDAEQRRAEIALERERLAREKAEDQRRRRQEQERERERLVAEQQLTAFRQRWYIIAGQAVAMPKLNWLTLTQRKEVAEQLELEVDRRRPADEPRMHEILGRTMVTVVEPLQAERDALERRQRLTDEALRSLPYSATDADKVKATAVIREVLRQFDRFADVCEMRVAAKEAIQPISQAIERRALDARLISWAVRQLPWSRAERDAARIQRECTDILAGLPADISEVEGKEALEPTVREASQEIEQRRAEEERRVRKTSLIQQGVNELSTYLPELRRKDELSDKEYWDPTFWAELSEVVRRGLEADLTGDENTTEVRGRTRAIIEGALK